MTERERRLLEMRYALQERTVQAVMCEQVPCHTKPIMLTVRQTSQLISSMPNEFLAKFFETFHSSIIHTQSTRHRLWTFCFHALDHLRAVLIAMSFQRLQAAKRGAAMSFTRQSNHQQGNRRAQQAPAGGCCGSKRRRGSAERPLVGKHKYKIAMPRARGVHTP